MDNVKIKEDVALLKGFVQVQEQQISSNRDTLVDLKTQNMARAFILIWQRWES